MEKINVVLMRPIERELIDQISSVNSAINISLTFKLYNRKGGSNPP